MFVVHFKYDGYHRNTKSNIVKSYFYLKLKYVITPYFKFIVKNSKSDEFQTLSETIRWYDKQTLIIEQWCIKNAHFYAALNSVNFIIYCQHRISLYIILSSYVRKKSKKVSQLDIRYSGFLIAGKYLFILKS